MLFILTQLRVFKTPDKSSLNMGRIAEFTFHRLQSLNLVGNSKQSGSRLSIT
jgi:hypothetical protein